MTEDPDRAFQEMRIALDRADVSSRVQCLLLLRLNRMVEERVAEFLKRAAIAAEAVNDPAVTHNMLKTLVRSAIDDGVHAALGALQSPKGG